MNSENYSYAKRSTEIDSNTGGIYLDIALYNSYQTPDDILPKILLRGKAVKNKFGKLMELASDFALKPLFDEPERLKKLLAELKAKSEAMLSFRGHTIAIQRMLKPLSQIYHWIDITNGLGYYHFLCDLVSNMDSAIDEIMEELNWIKKTFFTTHNMIISITADADIIPSAIEKLGTFADNVSTEAFAPVETHKGAGKPKPLHLTPIGHLLAVESIEGAMLFFTIIFEAFEIPRTLSMKMRVIAELTIY